jgi:hypothetical protein
MDGERFDRFSRQLVTPRSRRQLMGMLLAAAAGLFSTEAAGAAPKAGKPSKCYGDGSRCTNGKQCCSGVCANRQCEPEYIPECTTANDCAPGYDSDCFQRTCTRGVCGFDFAPYKTPLPVQTENNCQQEVCDGLGGITSIPDDTDLAWYGQCRIGMCSEGSPAGFGYKPAGTSCAENGGSVCDGAGNCVPAP